MRSFPGVVVHLVYLSNDFCPFHCRYILSSTGLAEPPPGASEGYPLPWHLQACALAALAEAREYIESLDYAADSVPSRRVSASRLHRVLPARMLERR